MKNILEVLSIPVDAHTEGTKELNIQKFIKEHPDNFRELLSEKPYCIRIDEDEHHLLLSYKISSKMTNEIVKECRGLILYKDDWSIAAYPFDKFFEYGETGADDIDPLSCIATKKLDGTMIIYWYSRCTKKWMVSTKRHLDAYQCKKQRYCCDPENSIGYGFAYTITNKYHVNSDNYLSKHMTYVYEYTYNDPQKISKFDRDSVTFITSRNNITHEESMYNPTNIPGLELIDLSRCTTLEEIQTTVSQTSYVRGKESSGMYVNEGVVLIDSNFRRLKVKTSLWRTLYSVAGSKMNSKEHIYKIMNLLTQNSVESLLELLPKSAQHRGEFYFYKFIMEDILETIHYMKQSIAIMIENKWTSEQMFRYYSEEPLKICINRIVNHPEESEMDIMKNVVLKSKYTLRKLVPEYNKVFRTKRIYNDITEESDDKKYENIIKPR